MSRSERASPHARCGGAGVGRRRLVLALFPIAMAACASLPPPGETPPAHTGRFAVSWLDPAAGDAWQRASGRFALTLEGTTTRVEVASPLGQTMAVATLSTAGAELRTADGARFTADRPDTLTQQAFGWPAPLSQLARWLAGQGVPPATAAGQASFAEGGWSVSIDAWHGALPARLDLTWPAPGEAPAAPAPGPANGPHQVRLRLVVDPPGPATR